MKREGVHLSASLDSALELLSGPDFAASVESVFVIGGGQVYAECMDSPLLSAIHLTQVELEGLECDTFMLPVDDARFRLWSASPPRRDGDARYSFLCYTRADGAASTGAGEGATEGPPALPPGIASKHEELQVRRCARWGAVRGGWE